jgi:hypothetical protein
VQDDEELVTRVEPPARLRRLPYRIETRGDSVSESKSDESYARQLTECATLDELRALTVLYRELAVDAHKIVATMTDDDFKEFRRGLKSERKGRFAGEAWAHRFSAVMMPLPMIRISQIASEYHVPFFVALQRVRDVRPDLLTVEDN